tara:strand:- start:429 stop:1754 length:1326 start_codon:yes stop_codon:yes gene_type:complete
MNMEQQNIEWKESWKDDYLKTIAAFANTEGGTLVIGKDDNARAVGVDNAKKLLEDIPNKIRNLLGLIAEVNLHHQDGNDCIEIRVEPYTVPISFRGKYYARSGSTTQQLSGHDLNELVLKKAGTDWDEVVEPRASLADIDGETITHFKKRAVASGRLPYAEDTMDTEDLLKNLGVVNDDNQYLRAAILLFGKDVRKFIFSAFVKIGRFGKSDSELLSQELVEGNAFELADNVLEILDRKYFLKTISYERLHRIETPPYPYEAIREILFNAIVHREYENTPVFISLYEDRMTIWNQGTLSKKLTVQDLKQKHASYPRNRRLADVFYKAGYIETWGRGTIKIMEECEKHGLPEPEIKTEQGGFAVTLFKAKAPVSTDDSSTLNDRQIRALDYIKVEGAITTSIYSEMFEVNERTALRDLEELISAGMIKKVGAARATRYIMVE